MLLVIDCVEKNEIYEREPTFTCKLDKSLCLFSMFILKINTKTKYHANNKTEDLISVD